MGNKNLDEGKSREECDVEKTSRRSFLKKLGAGILGVGALSLGPVASRVKITSKGITKDGNTFLHEGNEGAGTKKISEIASDWESDDASSIASDIESFNSFVAQSSNSSSKVTLKASSIMDDSNLSSSKAASIIQDSSLTAGKASEVLSSSRLSDTKAQDILNNSNLGGNKQQDIFHGITSKEEYGRLYQFLGDIIQNNASDQTFTSSTTITADPSNPKIYRDLTVDGTTLTVNTSQDMDSAVIIARNIDIINGGTIKRAIQGAPGGDDGSENDGRGGQGGGGLIIICRSFNNSGTVTAPGEDGGDVDSAAGSTNEGQPGDPGSVVRIGSNSMGSGGNGGGTGAVPGGSGILGGGGGGASNYAGGRDGGGANYSDYSSQGLYQKMLKAASDDVITNLQSKTVSSEVSNPTIYGAGGGGGSDDVNEGDGGGGGGSGGQILVSCENYSNQGGTISTPGGTGGNGSNSGGEYGGGGGGGGGAGGIAYVLCNQETDSGSLSSSGGGGGTGAGNGENGNSGSGGSNFKKVL